jgi:carbon monoxide dehydrogenase subunit G
MNMTGEQRVAAPRQQVWAALNDPEILRASLPGCQSLSQEADDRFTATIEVRVGPIGARFKGTVSLTDLNPPKGYTLILQGNAGITGTVKGSAKVQLREDAGNTVISYEVEAEVAGRLAQLGGPILDATAKQLAGKFFSRFGEIVGGTAPASAPIGSNSAPATSTTRSSSGRLLLPWLLSTAVAALAGFLIGRGHGVAESDWAGLSMGLLVIVEAGAAFEYGRRVAAAE